MSDTQQWRCDLHDAEGCPMCSMDGPVDLRQWARETAPAWTDGDWSGVRFLDAELDAESMVLSNGDAIGKRQAAAALAYLREVAGCCRARGIVRAVTGKLTLIPQYKLDAMEELGLHDGSESLTQLGCEVSRVLGVARYLERQR